MVVLGLTAIVGAAMCATLIAQSRVARMIGDRIAYNDVVRATRYIIGSELRFSAAPDIRAIAAESLGGRWFRASGIPCAADNTSVWIRFQGIRGVDTRKDSMLVLEPAGEIASDAARLSNDNDNPQCVAGTGESIFRIPTPIPGGDARDVTAVLIFESGNYYLATRALRYRLGGEGRQPVTEEYFRDGVSRFASLPSDSASAARVLMTLALRPSIQQTAGRTVRMVVPVANDIAR
jgi:hypothetical protein